MYETAMDLLNELSNNGYEAYIVGGFVRDYLLRLDSYDIDVTTNATPKELMDIFKDDLEPKIDYGSVKLIYKGVRFEITTYRKETNYSDNRHPDSIEYIDSLEEDLQRRDFTINTICMDKDGNIIDLIEIIKSNEPEVFETVELKLQIIALYSKIKEILTDRERLIIKLRYGLYNGKCKTQMEIAKLLGISRSYVSRIEKKAVKKLHKAFLDI